jgi:hypothetical protein
MILFSGLFLLESHGVISQKTFFVFTAVKNIPEDGVPRSYIDYILSDKDRTTTLLHHQLEAMLLLDLRYFNREEPDFHF